MDFRQSVNNKYVIGSLALFILFMGVVAYSYRSASSALGAVASNGGFPGIYNATTTDLALRDGYGSALAVDSGGRVILSPSSTGVGVSWDAVDGDILPDTNNAYDIGSGTLSFQDIFASGTLMVGDGTAANPSISFGADANTGIYRYGGDIIGLTTGGAARLLIGSTGISAVHDLVGNTNNAYDLGKYGNAWNDVFASGTGRFAEVGTTGNVTSTGIIYTGSWSSATDPGSPYPFMSFPLSATPAAGTRNNAIISMGTEYMLGFYGENTGAANAVQNRSVGVYAPSFKVGQMNTTSTLYIATPDGCGAWQFTASNTSPTLTPTSTSNCL